MSPRAFTLAYLATAAVALAACVVILPRRHAPGGAALALMLAAASWWSVCDAIELQGATLEWKLRVSQIQYIGVVSAAPFFFHAARRLSGRGRRMSLELAMAVWGVPLLSLAAAWTNPWHHWLWTAIDLPAGGSPFSTYHYGWWFWVLTAQHYALMVAATVLLLSATRRVARDFRFGMAIVLVAVALPWIGNAMYNLKLGPFPGLNWLTLSLGVSGSLLAWVVLREGLLDLLPQTRAALIDALQDAVIVLDARGREVFANDAAVGGTLADRTALARALGASSLVRLPDTLHAHVTVSDGLFDVHVVPVSDRWGSRAGRLIVVRAVSGQAHPEAVSADGDAAVGDRLLAICASCHRIRDEQDRWLHVEDYRPMGAQVQFTHGICADCMQTLYPELVEGVASAG